MGPRGALQGVIVVDLSRVVAGPLCTQMLADYGADVIKVEPPKGDETRRLGPPFDAAGNATYYTALNRGKRAMSLDLSVAGGQEVLERMLEKADVLVENFLPGTMERWGLGYEDTLAAKFPRLVYCSITGFGTDGPLGGLPGYDAVLQAMGGVMSVNGDPQSGPTRVGIPLVDHLTGYVAMTAILMALRVRDQTGQGQAVEATLFDTAVSLLVPHAANWLASGNTPGLLGSGHPNIAPYDKYCVSDGEVFLGVVNDGQFKRFCEHIGRSAMITDARFGSNSNRLQNREALRAEIEAALQEFSAGTLCEAMMKIGVPAGVVNSVPEAFAQPHAKHRKVLVERDGYKGVRSPMRLKATPDVPGGKPPTFSQDSVAVLSEFGFSAEEISQLQQSGVVPRTHKQGSISAP